jgi:hypothetical protein
MRRLLKILILFFLLPVGLAITFSIFTNDEGFFRRYRLNDLPFVYKVHEGTSAVWISAIDCGANSWTNVRSAYFEFSNGGTTTEDSVARDGVNLIYFDDNFDNFTPGSNTIAFSSTFTSGGGSDYHAVESDFIWNAGDFPPATDGDPDLIDLEGVVAHELGHHLGLGHTGAAGGSGQPGAGAVIPEATMYYATARGDTTQRSLHIDDIMGVTAIYPRWTLSGTVLDSVSSEPIPNAFFNLEGVIGAILGPVETDVWPGQPQIGGWVVSDTIFVDQPTAGYEIYPYGMDFSISFHAFGYKSTDTSIAFSDVQSIEDVITYNARLAPIDRFNFVIQASDSITQDPVSVFLEFTALEDVASGITYTLDIDSTGIDSLMVPPGTYDIVIKPDLPYGLIEKKGFMVSSDTTLQIQLNPANILIVDNDYFEGMALDDNVEQYYIAAINELAAKPIFAYRDLQTQDLPDSSQILQFDKLIWFTGGRTNVPLSDEAINLLTFYLDNGGKLFLSGQNLLTYNHFKSLFKDYIKVGFGDDNTSQLIVYNIPGDPITGDFTFFKIVGEEGANNQTTPDVIRLKEGTEPILRYSPPNQNLYAAVRTEDFDKDYKVVFFAFGFEAITDLITPANSAQLRQDLLNDIFTWLDEDPVSAIADKDPDIVIGKYHLEQNYPNPFNPTTEVTFRLGKAVDVDLAIYSVTGQKVRTLVKGHQKAGEHTVTWNGMNDVGQRVASGVYFYTIEAGDFKAIKKMVLIK